jgi:hypothetical protein
MRTPVLGSRNVLRPENHPAEVRRRPVDGAFGHPGSTLRDLLKPLHLLDQRRDVLEPGLTNLVAERNQLGVVVDEVAALRRTLRFGGPVHAREDFLLLSDDCIHLRICGGRFRSRAWIELSLLHFVRIKDESSPV